jgi:hypothetical protein
MLLACTHPGLVRARAQYSDLCFAAGVKELMAAAYNPKLTESFVNCIHSMVQIIEG